MPDDPTVVVVAPPASSPPRTEEPSSSEPAASEVVAAAGAAVAAASADVGMELGKMNATLEALLARVTSVEAKQAEITDCMDAVGEVLEEMTDEPKPEPTPEPTNPNPGGVEEVVVQAPAAATNPAEPQKPPASEPGFLRKMFLGR